MNKRLSLAFQAEKECAKAKEWEVLKFLVTHHGSTVGDLGAAVRPVAGKSCWN